RRLAGGGRRSRGPRGHPPLLCPARRPARREQIAPGGALPRGQGADRGGAAARHVAVDGATEAGQGGGPGDGAGAAGPGPVRLRDGADVRRRVMTRELEVLAELARRSARIEPGPRDDAELRRLGLAWRRRQRRKVGMVSVALVAASAAALALFYVGRSGAPLT